MKEEKSEGIVLRSFDYKERQKIATVLTPEHGLVSLIIKKRALLPLATPFCRAEFLYQKGKSDLFSLQDGTSLDFNLQLRDKLCHLQAAGQLSQALLRSQLPGASSHALYALTLSYIKQIVACKDPTALVLSFRFKLLKLEGGVAFNETCSRCTEDARVLSQGESWCSTHAPHHAPVFSKKEWDILRLLLEGRSFIPLRTLALDEVFSKNLFSIISNF